MNLDHEMFLRDIIEKGLKENPEYEWLNIEVVVKIENGRLYFGEVNEPFELLP